MKKRIVFGLILYGLGSLLFSELSLGQKTYTPKELRAMVNSGKYPKQGKVSMQTEKVDYVQCIKVLERMIASVSPNYPTQSIFNTNIGRTDKIWTNDSAMTITCSAPDKNIVITSAPYL